MFLLLFLLLPHSSHSPCPQQSACLLFTGCNSSLSVVDISKRSTVHSECTTVPHLEVSILQIDVTPRGTRHWELNISSSFSSLAGVTLFFGSNSLHFNDESTLKVSTGKEYTINVVHDDKLHAEVDLDDDQIAWLEHFRGNISLKSPNATAPSTQLDSFWEELKEKTPCNEKEINDVCKDHTSSPSPSSPSSSLQSIVIDNCETQEIKNMIETGNKLFNISTREVRCNDNSKFRLSLEGFFVSDWQLVMHMHCHNGSWQWKSENDELRTYEKQKLSCSFEEPKRFKAAFYALTAGGPAFVIIVAIIIVVIVCCCCRRKKPKRRRSNSATVTEMDNGELSSLGVKMKKQKKMNKTWTWSRETKQSQDTSSNVSSANHQESSGEEEKEKGKKKSDKKKHPNSGGKK